MDIIQDDTETAMQNNLPENQESQLVIADEKMIPELIQGQIDKLNELDAGVQLSLDAAREAEKSAGEAREKSAGWFQKKAAIESLQEAGVQLADAVQLSAKAQKLSFEFQQRLAKVTKYLFTLGVGNIAVNRTVVRELELRLNGASEEQLSDLARQEVLSVVPQLNRPPWPVLPAGRIEITATLHSSKEGNFLGTYRSDGPALSPDTWLHFSAKHSFTNGIAIKWQIVNTGWAARAARCLRGGFDHSGSEIWEHTLYRGKHWVECFAVDLKRGVSLARRGRFYVNIS